MKFDDFKKLYSLSKTLRFEAKPVGSTLKNIIESGLLEEDEHRAQSYVKVKKLIDEYHKVFIDRVLNDGCLTIENKGKKDSLEEYYESYMSKSNDENVSKTFKEIQENLRSVIAKKLTDNNAYANLFGNKLIESYKDKDEKNKIIDSDLIQFINTAEPSQLDSMSQVNPAKRNVLDLKNETSKNREKRNVLKISHTRHFKTTKKQSKTGCFYSF